MKPNEVTWKDLFFIEQHYPQFNLEDKIDLKENDIVTSKNVRKYVISKGHMKIDQEIKGGRKSMRYRKGNVLLKDFQH